MQDTQVITDGDLFDEHRIGEEEVTEEIPKERRNIHFKTPTRTVIDIYSSYKRHDLDPKPPFQRGYVWDPKKASRLVESVLLNVPIPPVYTAELLDQREIVIDGQQRLVSLFSFIDEKFPKGEEFKLRGLQVFKELNGKSFKDLEKSVQRAFENYGLPMIIITKDSDEEVKFEIFERLNTGSVKLNDQELRNCVYRGSYNDLIKDLSNNIDFQTVLQSPPLHDRMLDSELILRFFTFSHNTYLNYKPPMKQFLNKDIEKYNNLSDKESEELKSKFRKSVELTKTVFGEKAFRRFIRGTSKDHNGVWESNKINRGLFEIIMFGFTQFEKNQVVPMADSIREELIWLMTSNDEFIDAISGSATDKKEKILFKFETWIASLRRLLGYKNGEQRYFSFRLKRQLYENDPTCLICQQKIQTIDDAEIDHIEHYWRGGETISSNARLTHRFCNRSRGGGGDAASFH